MPDYFAEYGTKLHVEIENIVERFAHGWNPVSHWETHPDYPVEDWKNEVADDVTRLSYIDWVNHEIEMHDADLARA